MNRPGRRRGFTLIELLMVFLVLSVLAGLGILRYIDLKRTALAAKVAAEFVTIRVAAYNVWAEQGAWPPEAPAGSVPAVLQAQLPTGFSFIEPMYTFDWENLGTAPNRLVGVTFSTGDAKLVAKVIQTLGQGHPYLASGNTMTYIIVGPGGLE